MSMREQFIACWVSMQQSSYHNASRGIMTDEQRQALEDEAEKAMQEIEGAAAPKFPCGECRRNRYGQPERCVLSEHEGPCAWQRVTVVEDLDLSDMLRDPSADPDATPMSGEAAVRYAAAPREESLRRAFYDCLGTEVYWCTRDHSAWGFGTMSLSDFELARKSDEVLDSLVEIALGGLTRTSLMDAMHRGELVRQAAWTAYGQEPDGEGTKPHPDNWYRAEAILAMIGASGQEDEPRVESAVAARALKTWVALVRSELDATRSAGIPLGRDYLQGMESALRQAAEHAARIENDLYGDGPSPHSGPRVEYLLMGHPAWRDPIVTGSEERAVDWFNEHKATHPVRVDRRVTYRSEWLRGES